MSLIYSFLLFIFVLAYLPIFFYQYYFKGKYRGSLLQKLGFYKIPTTDGKEVIWLHAVSVGETKAASTLMKLIAEAYPNCAILVSTITQTGLKEAQRVIPQAHDHLLLPLDFKWIQKKLLKTFEHFLKKYSQ